MIQSFFARTTLIVATLCLLAAPVATVSPAEPSADGSDLSFLEGLALVVLEDGDVPKLHEARELVLSYGGQIAIMSPPSLLLGWVPFEARSELIGRAGIADVFYTDVLPGEVDLEDAPGRSLVNFFNATVRGEIDQEFRAYQEASSREHRETTRLPDSFDPPAIDEAALIENLEAVGLDIRSLEDRGIYPGGPTRSPLGNSDYMTGVIALSVFFVESDGSGSDPDMYTWTTEDMQKFLNGVATGLVWWASKVASYSGCSATFLIYYYSAADARCQQWVEPILHGTDYEYIWVNAIMSNFGFTSGGSYSRVTAFNTWQISTYQSNRAYSAFIPYNPLGAPNGFEDGHTAYAYWGGPYIVQLFRLTGSPTSQVFAHETGHIFYACDEYAGGCSHCGLCRNGVDNGNCEVCNPHSVVCMMRENEWSLCAYTPGQVGLDGVQSPCTPTPPPPLPTPTVAVSYPAALYQGLDGSVTVGGSDFYAGAWVDLGPDVFVHKTTLVGAESLKVDVTVLNTAAPGVYDVVVTNRDFQQATLPGGFEVLATTRHYFSPAGSDQFPYLTPASAATTLEDAISAGYSGDTLFVPTMTFSSFSLSLDTGVLLHGGWNSDFTVRDLASGKTVFDLNGDVTILPDAESGGLDGFILENGEGAYSTTPFIARYGGGVRIIEATATIANCELRSNSASGGANIGVGGAIYAENATVDIRDNYIWGNTATVGGGVYLYNSSGSITGNTISDNTLSAAAGQPDGGGIYLEGCANVALSGNTIDGNTGAQSGGGMMVENSSNVSFDGDIIANNTASFQGAGVAALKSELGLFTVDFDHNHASGIGGGLAASDTSVITATECRFLWNTAAVGGGLYAATGSADIQHNLLVGNSVTGSSAGILVSSVSAGIVAGNNFDRNSAGSGAGGVYVVSSAIEIFNNVISNTTGNGINCTGSPLPAVSYNLVWNSSGVDYNGCAPGAGAISLDPVYVDTALVDYHLAVFSPAIDSGRPGASYEDPDGSPGDMGRYGSHVFVMDQPSYPKNLTVGVESGDVVLRWNKNPEGDIENYAVYCDSVTGFAPSASNFIGFVAATDTLANLGAPADSAYYRVSAIDSDGYASGYSNEAFLDPPTAAQGDVVRYHNRLLQNVPNPFNPSTVIHYELEQRANVTLAVYNVAGQKVKNLVSAVQPEGAHKVAWDGTNDRGHRVASGLYFYRLQAGGFVKTRKMILLK